jgi:hypothetical protein
MLSNLDSAAADAAAATSTLLLTHLLLPSVTEVVPLPPPYDFTANEPRRGSLPGVAGRIQSVHADDGVKNLHATSASSCLMSSFKREPTREGPGIRARRATFAVGTKEGGLD